jgi:hypothetical protein
MQLLLLHSTWPAKLYCCSSATHIMYAACINMQPCSVLQLSIPSSHLHCTAAPHHLFGPQSTQLQGFSASPPDSRPLLLQVQRQISHPLLHHCYIAAAAAQNAARCCIVTSWCRPRPGSRSAAPKDSVAHSSDPQQVLICCHLYGV